MSFGLRLKEARKSKELTQGEVSLKLGIDDTTISKYENDKSEPDNETLKKLSALYGCSIDYLMDGKTGSDEVYELGDILKSLRGKLSLREAAKRSGLSYSYINSLENGKHPRTGAPINPTPDILRSLANAYDYPYEELMKTAGYISDEDSNAFYDFDPSMRRLTKKMQELSQDKRQLVESLIDALLEKQ